MSHSCRNVIVTFLLEALLVGCALRAPTETVDLSSPETADNSSSSSSSSSGTESLVVIPLTPAAMAGDSPCWLWATTFAEMTQCAADQASKAADRLAESVAAYRDRLAGERLRLFDSSQVSWERFRDDACRFQASGVETGSAHDMVVARCLRDLSEWRYQEVVTLSSCEEGDVSCPAREYSIDRSGR